MRIEFNNTFADILRFNASHQFRNIPCQGFFLLIAIFIFFAEYTYEVDGTSQSTFLEAFSIGLAWYLGIWAIQLLFNIIYLYSKKNRSVITTHIVELQDEAFYEETPYNRSYFYWSGIAKIVKITGFIAVYVTPHMAVIIPNRAFDDGQQREQFLSQLMSHVENA